MSESGPRQAQPQTNQAPPRPTTVIPAKAGTQTHQAPRPTNWVPAYAGMTIEEAFGMERCASSPALNQSSPNRPTTVIPAKAGTQTHQAPGSTNWVPACAGMTIEEAG